MKKVGNGIGFENSWHEMRGIREYSSKKALFRFVVQEFIKTVPKFKEDYNNLCLYKYSKPPTGLGCLDFYKWCEKDTPIQYTGEGKE